MQGRRRSQAQDHPRHCAIRLRRRPCGLRQVTVLPPSGVGKHLRRRIWHDTSAAGVVDFYPVPHRDRTEPPPARERSDPSRAVRRDRGRTGRADPADPGGPPARVVALVPRRAAEPVRGLHRPGSPAPPRSATSSPWSCPACCRPADYAREIFRNGPIELDPDEVERLLEVRQARQESWPAMTGRGCGP